MSRPVDQWIKRKSEMMLLELSEVKQETSDDSELNSLKLRFRCCWPSRSHSTDENKLNRHSSRNQMPPNCSHILSCSIHHNKLNHHSNHNQTQPIRSRKMAQELVLVLVWVRVREKAKAKETAKVQCILAALGPSQQCLRL